MVDTIRQKTIVGKNGKIELSQTQLKEGTSVEVIIVADSVSTEDETTYLLKSEANKKHLLQSIENVKQGKIISVDLDQYEESKL
jgi:antitoxin YefM